MGKDHMVVWEYEKQAGNNRYPEIKEFTAGPVDEKDSDRSEDKGREPDGKFAYAEQLYPEMQEDIEQWGIIIHWKDTGDGTDVHLGMKDSEGLIPAQGIRWYGDSLYDKVQGHKQNR